MFITNNQTLHLFEIPRFLDQMDEVLKMLKWRHSRVQWSLNANLHACGPTKTAFPSGSCHGGTCQMWNFQGHALNTQNPKANPETKKNICNAIAQCSYQVLVILGWKFMETWPPFEMWKGNQNNIFHKVALLVVFLLNLLCFFVPVVIVIFVAFVVFVVLLFLLFWLFLMFLLFLMF